MLFRSAPGALPPDLETALDRRTEMLRSVEEDLLMGVEGFDLKRSQALVAAGKRGAFAPRKVRDFVKDALERAGGSMKRSRTGPGLYEIVAPATLRGKDGIPDGPFPAAFEPGVALDAGADVRLASCGDPLVNAMIDAMKRDTRNAAVATLCDAIDGPRFRFVAETVFEDGAGRVVEQRIDEVWLDARGAEVPAPPAEGQRPAGPGSAFRLSSMTKTLSAVHDAAREVFRREAESLRTERADRASARARERRTELDRHFAGVIERLEAKRSEFVAAMAKGAGLHLHIQRVDRDLARARDRRRSQEERLAQSSEIRTSGPKIVAAGVVLPSGR